MNFRFRLYPYSTDCKLAGKIISMGWRPLLLFSLVICLCTRLYAGDEDKGGAIKGRVTTADGQPAAAVPVLLKGTKRAQYTSEDGTFVFRNVPPGSYEVQVSLMGYNPISQAVTITSSETAAVTLQLTVSQKQLQEVTITGNHTNKFAKKESDYIARLPLRNLENPQAYSVTTKELIQEQAVTDFSSAIRTIPGAALSSESAQGYTSVFMRGFNTNAYLRNGLYAVSSSGGDPQIIERLEAIKGPSGTLFGGIATSYGGVLNKVTKKPFDRTAIEAGLSFGSFGLHRITADVNVPVNEDKSLLFRVNSALHSERSFQDFGFKKTFLLAPSLSYKINDRLELLVEAELNRIDQPTQTYFSGAGGTGARSIDQIKTDYFRSYTTDDLTHKPSTMNYYFGQLRYKLNDNWQLSANLVLADFTLHGGNIFPSLLNDSMMTRDVYDYNWQYYSRNVQVNVTGEFRIGGLRNRLLAGLDYQYNETSPTGSTNAGADTFNYRKPAIPFMDVQKIRASYDASYFDNEKANIYAAYFSDVINFTDRLNLMLSLRYDYYDYGGYKDQLAGKLATAPYTQGAFAPKLGATYQLVKDKVSFFANYMQGFKNVAPSQQGQTFKPEFAQQAEGGVKISLMDDRISATVSYYDITVRDKVRRDPERPNASIQDGTQASKGVDVDLICNPVQGLNIVAGYGYNASKFTRSNAGVTGNRPLGTPWNIANVWASYTLQQGSIKGLGLGLGLTRADSYYFDDANTLTIPGYTLMRGTLFYNFRQFRIAVSGDNLTDKRYWDYNGTPQMPRRVQVGLALKM